MPFWSSKDREVINSKQSNKFRLAFIVQLVTVYLSLCSYLFYIYIGNRCDASILFEIVCSKAGQ